MITELRLGNLVQTAVPPINVATIKSTCTGTCSGYGTCSRCPPLIVIAMLLSQLNAQSMPRCCARIYKSGFEWWRENYGEKHSNLHVVQHGRSDDHRDKSVLYTDDTRY
jgi:hypothetical protein